MDGKPVRVATNIVVQDHARCAGPTAVSDCLKAKLVFIHERGFVAMPKGVKISRASFA